MFNDKIETSNSKKLFIVEPRAHPVLKTKEQHAEESPNQKPISPPLSPSPPLAIYLAIAGKNLSSYGP